MIHMLIGPSNSYGGIVFREEDRHPELGDAPAILLHSSRNGIADGVYIMLCNRQNPNQVKNTLGATPILLAAEGGHLEVVQMLLAAKATPFTSATYGTPLGLAVKGGHLEVARCLLEAGAALYPLENLSQCLQTALQRNDRPMAELLIQYGAKNAPAQVPSDQAPCSAESAVLAARPAAISHARQLAHGEVSADLDFDDSHDSDVDCDDGGNSHYHTPSKLY